MVSQLLGSNPWRGRLATALLLLALGIIALATPTPASSGPTADQLYWTDYGDRVIRRANLDGTGATVVVSNIDARDLAIDDAGEKMYWTNAVEGKIQRANLDGSVIEDLVTLAGAAEPRGIALDLVAGKVYWADHFNFTIERANLDGTAAEVFMAAAGARAVAVDGGAGKVYWSHGNDIRRANADGTGVQTIYSFLVFVPNSDQIPDLALDIVAGHVYFKNIVITGTLPTLTLTENLARIPLDGSGLQNLIQPHCVLGIAVDEVTGGVFWTANSDFSLCYAPGSGVVGPGFTLPGNKVWGIAIARDVPGVVPPTPTPPPPVGGIAVGGELRPLSVQTADKTPAGYVGVAVALGLTAAAVAALGAVWYVRRRL